MASEWFFSPLLLWILKNMFTLQSWFQKQPKITAMKTGIKNLRQIYWPKQKNNSQCIFALSPSLSSSRKYLCLWYEYNISAVVSMRLFKTYRIHLQSQQGVHGHPQQINCNDVGCILAMALEFLISMSGQPGFLQFSIETNDGAAYWQPGILPASANSNWMPLICLLVCTFCQSVSQ